MASECTVLFHSIRHWQGLWCVTAKLKICFRHFQNFVVTRPEIRQYCTILINSAIPCPFLSGKQKLLAKFGYLSLVPWLVARDKISANLSPPPQPNWFKWYSTAPQATMLRLWSPNSFSNFEGCKMHYCQIEWNQGGGGTWKRDQHSLFFFLEPCLTPFHPPLPS